MEFSYDVHLSLDDVLICANSEDPDEMQHHAAFHLGLHYFAILPVTVFPEFKGL